MSDERWILIDRLLQSALGRPPHEREAFIRDSCTDDEGVRDEVLSLLAHADSADKFLEPPPEREPLQPGARLGAYEIRAQIGEGGMGEVYRAHDSRLRRDIALKILPPEAADAERRHRFAREAQAVAALNHPGIVTIHSVEQSGDIHFLTMELVDGQTLDVLIPVGGFPIDRLLALAIPLADAVGAAHSQGIVHRDLKPANVMVTRDGRVKVMDFGLAKLSRHATLQDVKDASVTTIAGRLTEDGHIFGTVAYMSPEQAEGRDVDHRSDVFSLGVMLFELATGRRPFKGESQVAVLASIVKDTPPAVAAVKPGVPKSFSRLVQRCLAKDPARRYQSVLDLRHDLQEVKEDVESPDHAEVTDSQRRPWFWLAAALGAAALAIYVAQRPTPAAPGQVLRMSSFLNEVLPAYLTISNDGSKIAYMAGANPNNNIVVRRLDEFEGKVISGASRAGWPLFSPNGEWIAFSDAPGPGKIRKIRVEGGVSIPLGDGSLFRGATWGPDNKIVFGGLGGEGLMEIPAEGGSKNQLTEVDASKGERAHWWPQYLPDGRHVLFTVSMSDPSAPYLFAVLDRVTGRYETIGSGGLNGRYVKGHLAFVREGTLFVVPFDLKALQKTGSEVPVEQNVRTSSDQSAEYAVSDGGLLVYFATSKEPILTTLAWVDRSRNTTDLPGSTKPWGTGRLARNGRFVANRITDSFGNQDIWTHDVTRGALDQVTFDGAKKDFAIWSNDSTRILYSLLTGEVGIYAVTVGSAAKPVRVATTPYPARVQSMTRDGQTLVYSMAARLFVATLDVNGKAGEAKPLNENPTVEREAQFSPDGKWIAYTSTSSETGKLEVYLREFPIAGAPKRISSDGGGVPRWSANGRELYYWERFATRLMSVAIPPGNARLAAEPKEVFTLERGVSTTFDVTPDSNKFLIEQGPTVPSQLNFVTNWFQVLAEKVKQKK